MDITLTTKETDVTIRTLRKFVFLAAMFPALTFAQGSVVGTAPLLLGLGVTNFYFQGQLNDSSAWTVAYSNISGDYQDEELEATVIAASYKGYFSEYANGGYWQLGLAQASVDVSTSDIFDEGTVMVPIAVVGYETTVGGGVVLGGEVGVGTGHGWGFLGVNAGFTF